YLDDLQRMFLANKHALGSPGLPGAHFRAILEQFERSVFVHLVRAGEKPLSAVMSFAHGDTLIAYYAGTQPGADRAFSASNFMYMALQEWAVERGFQGFEPRPLQYRYRLVRNRRPPSFNPSNPRTAILRNAWSRLPLWLAGALSE